MKRKTYISNLDLDEDESDLKILRKPLDHDLFDLIEKMKVKGTVDKK